MEEQTKLITLENLQQYHDLASDEVNSLISGQQSYTDTKISELSDKVDTDIENLQLWAQGEDNKILLQANEHTNNTLDSLNLKGGEGEDSVEQTSGNASGANSTSLGHSTVASGSASFAEGEGSLATGNYAHAEGHQTQAIGAGSHAEGGSTYAQGEYSHAEGYEVIANGDCEHAQGKYNVIQSGDSVNRYADVVGNGTDANNRSNAYTLDWEGNAWFAGDVKTGGTSYDDAESLIKASDITFDRASDAAKVLRFKVSGKIIGEIPAPQVQFNSATTFVAKEVKSFYEESGLVPETVNGFAWGSASDPAHGDINYLTEENGPYLVLTNINIENPIDLLGGNVIILKDILSTELPGSELLTIQFNGEDIGQYDGSEPKTINIQAATEEYVKQLIGTIQTASFEVVDTLPESDIKSNVIYLVPANVSGLNNIYDEYIYVNDKWELIGNTSIDLSQYATKEYVDNKDINNVKYTTDNNVELKNHIVAPFGSGLYGNSPDNGWTNLAAVKGYNLDTENEIIQTELGSATLHTNINSKDRPTIETSEGQEQVRYLSDTEIDDKSSSKTTTYSSNKIDSLKPVMLSVPVRTKKDKVYTQEEILAWFKVTSISDLKLLFTRDNPLFAKYGITLSTLPHYYKMNVEYAAFESANQIKLVFLGLDTSNDEPSRFTIIANLDGTIIEGNSNVQLVIEPLSKSSYNDLLDKPTINNIELKDNVSLDDLNLMDKEQVQSAINSIIDDSKPSLTKTYSSSKIESLSGVKVLTGTNEKPIIANDLSIGTYVISGVVQSSQSNTTNITVPKKLYSVDKTDLGAAIWYENPKTSQQTYYEFRLEGNEAPTEKLQTYVTTEYLSSATLDGGTWI